MEIIVFQRNFKMRLHWKQYRREEKENNLLFFISVGSSKTVRHPCKDSIKGEFNLGTGQGSCLVGEWLRMGCGELRHRGSEERWGRGEDRV